MSKHLTAALQDLRDRYGITAADLTADEIELLVFACKRVENPFSSANAELMERPIYVCKGVYMWPLTAGAHVWLTEFAGKWWPENVPFYKWARIYALINARKPDAFCNLTERKAARSAIIKCVLKIVCHIREIGHAVNLAYGIEDYTVPKANQEHERAQTDFSSLVARLEVASGIKKDEWLWGRSLRSLIKSYVELSELSAAAFGSKNDKAQIELDEAIDNLARVVKSIGERLKNEQGT